MSDLNSVVLVKSEMPQLLNESVDSTLLYLLSLREGRIIEWESRLNSIAFLKSKSRVVE